MTKQQKTKVVNIAGFCGGGLFLLLNMVTGGAVPGGFVGGVAGYAVFGGIAAFVVYVLLPKETAPSGGAADNPGDTTGPPTP